MAKNNKKIKSKFQPIDKKIPKQSSNPESAMKRNISWHFGRMEFDNNSDWCWNSCISINRNNEVFQKLCDYEKMKLSEVLNGKNHRVDIEGLNKKAIRELEEKKINDIECLHSFHINATTRFYCIPLGNIMKLLWYDPFHSYDTPKKAVYPPYRRHT